MATTQETYAVLLQELSASGDQPLNASTPHFTQPDLTLRQAIGLILWKQAASLTLADYGGRPRDPKTSDDMYGHLLSLRAELLITQAIVTDLAARLGTDVQKIRADVVKELNT
jgi:hypothetical protein